MSSRFMPSQLIGVTLVFSKFVVRPVTSPKFLRMSAKLLMSLPAGFMKITASSAYMEILKRAALPRSLCSNFSSVAFRSSRCSGSNARMNRSGERGSPYRRPRPWMCSVGVPFTRIVEVDVERIAAIQFIQRWGKPLCCIRESK